MLLWYYNYNYNFILMFCMLSSMLMPVPSLVLHQTDNFCKIKDDIIIMIHLYTSLYTMKMKNIICMYIIYRGYYTAVRRYDFYLRVVKTIFYERAQRVSKILFLTREDKSHIFKPPCNVLFII
jgi:hypothetical protein